MRGSTALLTGGAIISTAVLGLGLVLQPTTRVGQLVLLPAEVPPLASGISARIDSCEQTAEGLRVRGWAPAVEGGQRVLAVPPTSPDDPGVQVGSGYAASAGLVAGHEVGAFVVTLAWAHTDATFTVAEVSGAGLVHALGPAAACPP